MMPDPTTRELKAAIASALEPVMEREAAEAGPHPTLDELIRYHRGELDEAGEQRVQRHLVACPECLETLLDLDDFVGAGGQRQPDLVDDFSEEAGWPGEPVSAGARRRLAFAAAASVLLVVSSLAVWVSREREVAQDLRRQVATLSAPRPDVPIVDLLPDSSVRGEAGAGAPVELPAGADYFTFVLSLPQASELTDFEAELVAAGGRTSWRGPLSRSRYGTFTLGIGRRRLSPGENKILLYGLEQGHRRLIETYTFRLGPPGKGS